MISLLLENLFKCLFPNIKLENKLIILLFALFVQLELLIIFIRDYYLLYVMMFVLLYESISDYYTYEIHSIFNYLLIVIGIINRNVCLINFVIPLCLFIFSYFDLLGKGDTEIFIMLSFYYRYEELVYILFISSILSSLYLLITKKDKIALVPFISLSVFIITLYSYIH